jgi:hypothetical protein
MHRLSPSVHVRQGCRLRPTTTASASVAESTRAEPAASRLGEAFICRHPVMLAGPSFILEPDSATNVTSRVVFRVRGTQPDAGRQSDSDSGSSPQYSVLAILDHSASSAGTLEQTKLRAIDHVAWGRRPREGELEEPLYWSNARSRDTAPIAHLKIPCRHVSRCTIVDYTKKK